VRFWQRFVDFAARCGTAPDDTDEVRTRKTLLTACAVLTIPIGLLWSSVYILLGQRLVVGIIALYLFLSATSLVLFAVTRRYRLFAFLELLLFLLLPFLVQWIMGGFVASSGILLWSFLSPVGAVLFLGRRSAPYWFGAFLALVVLAGALDGGPEAAALPPAVILTFFVLNIAGVSFMVFALLLYFVALREEAMRLLRIEQEKSENLLLNILPRQVAAILKNERRTIADSFGSASILFADVVGFTPLSSRMTPVAMVEMLNRLFTRFDELAEAYGLEKIKTIGDCYMVAAGVPVACDDHAERIARMALEMREHVRALTGPDGEQLQVRVGIASGPVVAGVIGRRKFIYDLWGDTVNTASRMESHGEPDMIQITRETYELLHRQFVCEPRGRVQVKGKGLLDTWHLVAERSA
jgi:adenylate cyclase